LKRARKPRLKVQSTELVMWVAERDADAYRRAGWTIAPAGPGQHHDLSYGVVLATRKLDRPLRRWI
jgi:hypothetical protein